MNVTTRTVRRTLSVTVVAATVAALGLLAPSSAEAAASDCPSGSLCVWDQINYTGNRCSWSNADSDWTSGSVTCSWADDRNVKSVYNHGTSSSYEGVGLYSGAGYSGYLGCIGQGVKGPGVSGSPGLKVLSHKWLTSC
ncbi:peptidase inhibitor family I36 protein [Streptomyces arenae]|uniref:peptidase inhibitor family I36 protein n=1 Tax=Streptomyces arenae TaxID=29301 RepID=UPI00265ABE31|nr:peptidase inhibitor family I36 protein [Streptomyces arenae]MCG7210202.1 peptidase inhibitor family I36 protein [Streptomyces arenae]